MAEVPGSVLKAFDVQCCKFCVFEKPSQLGMFANLSERGTSKLLKMKLSVRFYIEILDLS